MTSDRVSADRLLERLRDLYPNGALDYDVPDFDGLTRRYEEASALVSRKFDVREQREWDAYGCGFASYFDSWFYKKDKQFRWTYPGAEDESYSGVFVIFSLLEPMFAVGQGEKSWNDKGGGGYLPNLEAIDHFENQSVRALSDDIRRAIRISGIPQASKRTLRSPLPRDIEIETNLSHGDLSLFDAYFHWMD